MCKNIQQSSQLRKPEHSADKTVFFASPVLWWSQPVSDVDKSEVKVFPVGFSAIAHRTYAYGGSRRLHDSYLRSVTLVPAYM